MKQLIIVTMLSMMLPNISFAATIGTTAPEFSLPDLDGIEHSLPKGKVIYLDFWASWCAPCRVSFPEIIKLQNDLGGDEFEVIAISVDDNIAAANKFLRRFEVPYTILSDTSGQVAGQYELPGMPTSFVIDSSGTITLRHSGFKPGDMESIRQHIEELLGAGS